MERQETYDEEYENIAVHKSNTVTYLQPKTCVLQRADGCARAGGRKNPSRGGVEPRRIHAQ